MPQTTTQTPPRKLATNGIHLVRTAVLANLQLSQMADQKASILMGATFVVFTIAVSQVNDGVYVLPLLILAVFAFVSAVLAVLAALPRVKAIENVGPEANVLFFGVSSAMAEADFIDRVIDNLETDEATYRLMLRDVHQNGLVLQRKKYRYLSWAYRTFLVGLVVTLAAFLFEFFSGISVIGAGQA